MLFLPDKVYSSNPRKRITDTLIWYFDAGEANINVGLQADATLLPDRQPRPL